LAPERRSWLRMTALALVFLGCLSVFFWVQSQRGLSPNQLRSLNQAELERRAEHGPDRLSALCILGERTSSGPNPEAALTAYQSALRLDSTDARAVAGYVLARNSRTSPGYADVVLRELIRAQPDHYAGHLALGVLYLQEGELDEAGVHLREATRLAPDDAEVHYRYGLWSASAGSTGKGIEHFQMACRLSPRVALYHLALADLQIHLAQYAEARSHLDVASRLTPDSPTLLYHRGRLLLSGRPSVAESELGVRTLERAVQAAPDWSMPRLTLGKYFIGSANPLRGVRLLEPLLDREPDKQLLATLARGYYKLGRRSDGDQLIALYNRSEERARKDSDEWLAAKRAGTKTEPRLRRARHLKHEGRQLQALALYRAVLTVEPGNTEANKAIDELTLRPQ